MMLSSSSSNVWMPSPGRYPVDIGSSLGRALRARKNEMEMSSSGPPAVPVRSKGRSLPERDFFSFRYGHKPQSIDPQKPGQIEFTTNDAPTASANEQTKIVLERASIQPGESVMFRGQQATPNKYDCVLIFDEDSGTFTLEKLDDGITLTHDRSLQPIISRQLPEDPSPSPAPSTKVAPARDKNFTQRVPKIPKYEAPDEQIAEVDDIDDEIAKMLPPEPKISAPIQNTPRYKKEEEEDEEEEGRPLLQQKQEQRRYISTKKETKPSRPTKAIPKKKAVALPSPTAGPPPALLPATNPSPPIVTPSSVPLPPKPKPAPSAKPKRPAGRQTEATTEVFKDVEEFPSVTHARSSKPPKVKPQPPRPIPSPPRSSGLALPGASAQAAIAPPPTLPSSTSIVRQTKMKTVVQPPPPPAPAPAIHDLAEDSDEDDWDEVTPANGATVSGSNARIPDDDNISMLEEEIFGSDSGLNLEGEGEGDVVAAIDDEFGRQLEEEMFNLEEEEDDEDADMEPVEEYDGPISLNALAGGGGMNVDSDDDTSSSDDSEY